MTVLGPRGERAAGSGFDGALKFLRGGGELGGLIAGHDWAATSLGAISAWPGHMRTVIAMILQSPVPIVTLWNEDGVMIYNDAYSVFAAARHPFLLGSRVREGWHEVADFNDHIMRTVLAGGTLAYRGQKLVLYRTGRPETVWLDLNYSPVLDDDGKPAGVIAIVQEATGRVQAERRRIGEHERLRQMFDQAPSFMSMKRGPEHRFELVNQAYMRFIGERDVTGKTIREAVPEVEAQGLVALLDEAYATGIAKHSTAHPVKLRRRKDGPLEQRYMDFVYQPVRDANGEVNGIFAMGNDVTDRVTAEQRAVLNEVNFNAMARVIPVHVFLAGPDGVSYWINTFGAAYFGAPQNEAVGDRWGEFVHEDDVAGSVQAWQAAVAAEADFEAEYRIRRADGMYRWHLARAVPVRDEAGQVARWIGSITDIHERKLAEAQSTRDRDRMWSLSQELMLVFDFKGIITAANPSITRISGWTEAELLGRNLAEFLHPEDLARTLAEVGRLAQGGVAQSFEARSRNKDGGYRLVDWAAVPDAGRIHAVGRDITEERAALREIERTWMLSPVVKAVAKVSGELLAVNPAWTGVLGWTEEETLGRNVMAFVAQEDREAGMTGMTRLADGMPVVDFNIVFATKTGGRRCIAWTTVPEGEQIYGFGRDITAELEAAAALAQSRAERDRIWSATNDLMATAGIDGYLKSVNPAWSRLLGYSDTQLLSRNFMEFFDPADHERTAGAVARLAAGQVLRDFENQVVHADGRRSWISWTAEPEGAAFYLVGRNVTEQRMAEEALRQSQKMEAVGQLTGGIAHDFNNLLQGITGSLDLMQTRITQGRLAELDRFVSGAMGAANRASALTHRLLAFARRQPLDPRPVGANPLVASMEDMLRRTMGERIELELVLGAGLWLTLCDPNQLENAVLNLAINARDAMPDGGRLTIETANAYLDDAGTAYQRDVRPGQYVCICVTDTGVGMDQDTMDKAFEPFFTTKPIGQGTGLGLSMIYGFARQSEGYAKLHSEPGQGTTVKLYLPRYGGDTSAQEPETAQLAVPEAAGETVLVVEDEAVVRGLIVEVLKDLGYAALEAADGPAALQILQSKRRLDLLVTDIGLPGLNGRQVADAGRLLRPELKVLFMTGYAENAAFASGFLEQGMAMITKPFAMEALATRIRGIIEEG